MWTERLLRRAAICALLCHCVSAAVPSPTNISVACHNFVNVLYWNYSNPAEQLLFSVLVKPYLSDSHTVSTSQTYLDVSEYSSDATDNYLLSVTAHVGQEKSENASIEFTYSNDYFDEKFHKYKCSLDFPAINMSVHKDVVEATFWHPYVLYDQDFQYEEFKYKITHDQEKISGSCDDEDEYLCTAKIYLNQSLAGQCVELKFEGKIAAIPTQTSRKVCVPQQTSVPDHTVLIVALVGGGCVLLFVIVGVVWILCKKWSKMPKLPEALWSIVTGPSSSTLLSQPETSHISPVLPEKHTPLLDEDKFSYDTSPISPISLEETDCKTSTDLADTDVYEPKVPVGIGSDDDSLDFGQSSDYNSPKYLCEMSPEDFAEGYGSRPPII